MLPPLWICASAGAPVLGLGVVLYRWVMRDETARLLAAGHEDLRGARARSAAAAVVFSTATGFAGWLIWLLSELPWRGVVFLVLWSFVATYFIIAAGAFRTQLSRFMPWRLSSGAAIRETTLHLVEALLWGPITVMTLLGSRRRP